MAIDRGRAESAIREFLSAVGLDADDPRLVRTPARVALASEELLGGEGVDPVPMLREGRISIVGDAASDAPVEKVHAAEQNAPDTPSAASSHALFRQTPGEESPRTQEREPRSEKREPNTQDGEPKTQVNGPKTQDGDSKAQENSPQTQDSATPDLSEHNPYRASQEIGANPAEGNLVLVRNIRFRAMCEHHLLPFDGWVHLAYLPGDSIIGFGRLYDLVEICSSKLILQERLGEDLVDALMAGLDAQGALAVIEARQGCVADRGPRQADSDSVTLAGRGALNDPQKRADALRLIALGGTNRDTD